MTAAEHSLASARTRYLTGASPRDRLPRPNPIYSMDLSACSVLDGYLIGGAERRGDGGSGRASHPRYLTAGTSGGLLRRGSARKGRRQVLDGYLIGAAGGPRWEVLGGRLLAAFRELARGQFSSIVTSHCPIDAQLTGHARPSVAVGRGAA